MPYEFKAEVQPCGSGEAAGEPVYREGDGRTNFLHVAFKEEFWRLSVEDCTGNMAFRRLGYGSGVLGFERVHNITERIRRAARIPDGLQGKAASRMRISKENFSRAELEKMPRRESEQRLQNKIVYLQQQMALLKNDCVFTAAQSGGFHL